MRTHRNALFAITACLAATSIVGCASGRSPDVYRDDTEKLLLSASDGITNCYATVLKGTPTAQGSVSVHFYVQENTGAIRRAKVDKARSTAPEAVQECVTKYIGDLRLTPADEQRGEAEFTWDFTPKQAPPADAAKPAS